MAIGPLLISLPRLFLLLGLMAVLAAGWLVERRGGRRSDGPLWVCLVAGLLGARLVYVVGHHADYLAAPWQALYLWQDGYSPAAGVVAAALAAAWQLRRHRLPVRSLALPLLAGLLVWGGMHGLHAALQRGIDKPLPELSLADLSGQPVALQAFRGQPLVINLWATWCPPCRREMPVLADAQARHPQVHFVFVNQAEGSGHIRQYLSGEQLSLRNVLTDVGGRVGRHFDAPGLPTTLFFNADGQLVDTHLGELSRARLGDYLRKLETP